MAVKLSPDRTLFVATVCLVSFGLVMLYSASAVVAHDAHRSSHFFLVKQSMWACVGLLLMLALTRFDYRRLKHPVVIYGLLAAVVVLLVGVLFTPPLKNAHRWIRVGLLSFQPSELAKLALVIALAYQLDRRFERLNEFVTRYLPDRVCSVPVPLQGILLPRFAPNDPSRVEELTPAAALTEFLGYCFEPKEDTEGFFDKVIRLLETHKVFRRRFDGTDSLMRDLDTVLQR